ncbi:porin family protein [Riemerella columbipharyngis]|uniref:Outer membrane protein beta-barrel domain-containing protein n=1 Tax=Riemerella columbipharyngis TaxID=1071918 RepID=A0A1G7B3J6_9FLAO|nr:porin family protein [Riemerella columbipharyngis]SDE21679.1 Outer membrane protein beta-barrel domain-containing protein [Riemerella columbipharyngis]
MKKLMLCTSLLVSALSFAQFNVQFDATRFGLVAGANYSGVRNAHNPSGKRLGFQGGLLAIIPTDYDNQFYLQPQVEYYQSGETSYSKKEGGNKSTKYYNNYISVPIFFKGYFSENETEFFGQLGPRFNFLIHQRVENPSRIGYGLGDGGFGKANSFNFAIAAGVGFSYKRKWEITLNYDLGLSNTYPKLKYYEVDARTGDPNSVKKKSEQAVTATLSYIFD